MIPKIIYTAHLAGSPVPESFRRWRTEWQQHHPEWDVRIITLNDREPIFNHAQWAETFKLPEPAGATSRLNILRYELLAREGGVFIDPDRLPIRPIDELVDGVRAFCSTTQQHGRPHLLSPAVMGAVPCHAALWHCVRDLAHSILVYRGIWDQTGPGYLTRVINEHGHFRDVVPYHWGLFEQAETDARQHGGAYLYNASLAPAEAVA
ncbi:MAG: hypothetical protein Tsb0013_00030 [Phycisphaerales bacterium]